MILRRMTRVGSLSAGKKQMIQIAKALYRNAKVISFDEPTSSLSNAEVKTPCSELSGI